MAVLFIQHLAEDVQLGVWKIDESLEELELSFPHLQIVLACHKNNEVKRQKLAIYALMYQMTGYHTEIIHHNEEGKPLLANLQISISDTKGFVAVIIGMNRNVAVDIEYQNDRVNRIASRFIRNDEKAPNVTSQLVHWSAKETTYKYFSSQHLQYFDMRLKFFTVDENGTTIVENLKDCSLLPVHYLVTSHYVLTYTY